MQRIYIVSLQIEQHISYVMFHTSDVFTLILNIVFII